jgi:pyrroloquinoline quinone (PQQ) biosynthesis protein C
MKGRTGHVSVRRRRVPGRTPLPPASEIVQIHKHREVADHSFFSALRAAPVNLQAIWVLMANLRAGISRDFVRWLAVIVERVDDRRIASLVARQLNDELGNGEVDRIHSRLLDRFVSGLEPWRPASVRERELLRPGRRLAESAWKLFRAHDAYQGVGALIVGEIFAEKMDRCLGDEIRRQGGISDETLTWLTVHERLEIEHAADSDALARLVPDQGPPLRATWRGAVAQWDALWQFLADVHEVAAGIRS